MTSPAGAEIEEIRTVLSELGADHPDRGMLLYQLGIRELIKFSDEGVRADLDAGIDDLKAAVTVLGGQHEERPMALAALAGALGDRFERTGQSADLEAAFDAAREAIDTAPVGHPARPACQAMLAAALLARYQGGGDLGDLDAAIRQLEAAADATGGTGFGRAGILSNLGMALHERFERTSVTADLEAAVKCGRAAVADRPPGDPERPGMLSNLGNTLVRRFQQTGALADVDDAIEALTAAAQGMPPGHPHRAGSYSNLATGLLSRYLRVGEPGDLDAAINAGLIAVDSGDRADPRWAGMATNTALALRSRYERTEVLADLGEAIAMARAAVDATPAGRPDYATHLTNLAAVLHKRFERTGDPADLNGAIRASYEAKASTPAGHVERVNALANLGVALRSRFKVTALASDRNAALSEFVAVTAEKDAPPSIRTRASIAAALLVQQAGDRARAAALFAQAVSLLSEIAPRNLSRGDQQHAVSIVAGVSGAAAYAALADPGVPEHERPARALALLEASRGILLSQALETRDDLTDLRHDHRELAEQFVVLRERLDQPERDTELAQDPLTRLGTRAAERERLAGQFARTLAQIRAIDGFAGFGLPPSPADLSAEAASGPVAAFTVDASGGGALLLTTSGVTYLDLPGLTDQAVTAQVNAFHAALRAAESDDEHIAGQARNTLTRTLEWLWDSAAGPVLDALGYRTRPAGGEWPRVWWMPGGKLSLLPIHAAGYHGQQAAAGESATAVIDAVVSSYTPTLRALRYARQQATDRDGAARALVVAMPATEGQRDLPGAGEELAVACAALPSPIVLAEPEGGVQDSIPTRKNVLRYLPACTVAHFACHADSDAADPSRSLLLLHDYKTSPLTVAALAPVDHDRLELTYLSACSTAFTASTELADEAIHLTSAFLLAGSRHVVGTLWPASNLVALRVATAFYAGLRPGGDRFDTDHAAVALHNAVRAVRDLWPEDPVLWAPYLHAGG